MANQPARKSPTAAEALNEPIEFEWRGTKYTVPATNQWPYEALEAFEEGKLSGFLRALLGEEQHDAFKATKPLVSDMTDFIEQMQKALGIAGN